MTLSDGGYHDHNYEDPSVESIRDPTSKSKPALYTIQQQASW